MDTNSVTTGLSLSDFKKEKKRYKQIAESKDFKDLVGEILHQSVPDMEELTFLIQKYDLLILIVEDQKVSLRFQNKKTDPNQKKKPPSETMNSIAFDKSLFELVAMLKSSFNSAGLHPAEYFQKERKQAQVHLVCEL